MGIDAAGLFAYDTLLGCSWITNFVRGRGPNPDVFFGRSYHRFLLSSHDRC